jgi:hypothetical protein
VLGRQGARAARFRPRDLPSNGEIRDALLAMAALSEGPERDKVLFVMRVCALEVMQAMEDFEPRLIGSVSTGHVRRGSDVDVQLFTDDPDAPELRARELGWPFETERVTIRKGGAIREYLHLHVRRSFDVEFTVYPRADLRERPRSSTDGKPIARKTLRAVRAMLEGEHAALWKTYQSVGVLPELTWDDDGEAAEAEADPRGGPAPGPFDGLLAEWEAMDEDLCVEDTLPSDEERKMLFDEGTDEDYDPLPGFENL